MFWSVLVPVLGILVHVHIWLSQWIWLSWAVRAGLGPTIQLDETVSMQDHLSSDISWVWGSQYHSQLGYWLERFTGLTEGCCTYCYSLVEGKDQVKINQRERHIGQSPGEFQMQSFHWLFFSLCEARSYYSPSVNGWEYTWKVANQGGSLRLWCSESFLGSIINWLSMCLISSSR